MKEETAVVSYEQKALAEFVITPAEIAKEAEKFLALKVLEDDSKSYKTAREALTVCVSYRTSTDKRRKELGEDARTWVNAVNAAQKALIAPLAPAEEHLRNELQIEDGRQKAVKAKKAWEERERVAKINAKIDHMRLMVLEAQGKNSNSISEMIQELSFIDVIEAQYQEFTAEAQRVLDETTAALNSALQARITWEKIEAERQAEDKRLARVQAEQEAEAARQAEERRKIEAEKDRLNREAFERQVLWNARYQAEKDAVQKAEREAQAQKEREEKEAAEKARAEALKPDKEKLLLWVEWFKPNIPRPELQSEDAQVILGDALCALDSWLTDIRKRVEAL